MPASTPMMTATRIDRLRRGLDAEPGPWLSLALWLLGLALFCCWAWPGGN